MNFISFDFSLTFIKKPTQWIQLSGERNEKKNKDAINVNHTVYTSQVKGDLGDIYSWKLTWVRVKVLHANNDTLFTLVNGKDGHSPVVVVSRLSMTRLPDTMKKLPAKLTHSGIVTNEIFVSNSLPVSRSCWRPQFTCFGFARVNSTIFLNRLFALSSRDK